MAVLYQKYRPQSFSEVVGQDGIIKTLANASKAGQMAHAYLFTGSRGIGKTTIARIVAKAVNCENLTDGDPCGSCSMCTAISTDSFLDVVEIDAASHTGVDNIRELIEHVKFRPTLGKMKVFIIDEVHMLSKSAFNALLKTLEEPPAHAMFILATTDIEKVPDTIISRTQRFDFRKITPGIMEDALAKIAAKENIKLPEGTLQLIVNNAEGGMRDALSLLGTVSALGDTATSEDIRKLLGLTTVSAMEELIGAITSKETSTIPAFFEELAVTGTDFTVFNRSLLEYLRSMLVYKMTQNDAHSIKNLDSQQSETLKAFAGLLTVPQLLYVIRLFLRSYKEISGSPLPELPMLLSSVEAALHLTGTVEKAAVSQAPAKQQVQSPNIQAINNDPKPFSPGITKAAAEIKSEIFQSTISATTISPAATALEDSGTIDQDVTINDVLSWWPDVVQRIKTVNSPLATLLKNSPIHEVSGGKITIGVKYLFHKEHVENTKNTALILETISAVSGKRLYFRTTIIKDLEEPVVTHPVDALSDAIKIFGGELVE